MYQLRLDQVPNQGITTTLGDQTCTIRLRTFNGRLFFSLFTEELGVVCENVLAVDRSMLIRADYKGFVGDFIFLDTQGEEAPTYDKLNTRFLLLYDVNGFKGELQ